MSRTAVSLGSLLLAASASLSAGALELRTAALLDWVPREQLSEEKIAEIPGYCSGAYVKPDYLPEGLLQPSEPGGEYPVRATADAARMMMDQRVELTGNIRLVQENNLIEGNGAVLDQEASTLSVDGGIKLRNDQALVLGERVDYRMDSGYFEIQKPDFLFYANELRGNAAEMERPADQQLDIVDGFFTTCAPHDKSWSFRASEVHLDQKDGRGTAKHFRMYVGEVPVFYSPYLSFPIDRRRRSGFLYPSFGTSNTGRGIFIATPYYLNLAPNYDMTITPQFINGRGLYTETEGRLMTKRTYSELDIGYIGDDDDYAANRFEDGERWGVSLDSNITITDKWRGVIDFSAVSDDDFLTDLTRDLAIEEETHLKKAASVSYQNDVWQFNGVVQGFQTIDSTIADRDKPYRTLPQLDLDGTWQTDWMRLGWDNQFAYFERDNDDLVGSDKTNGARLRTVPELTFPYRPAWGFFVPGIKLDHTDYLFEDQPGTLDDHRSRTVPFYTADAGLYFDRSAQWFATDLTQSLEPRVFYVYSPEKDQENLPDFDTSVKSFAFSQLFSDDRFVGGDRIGDNNRLTVALTKRITEVETGIDRAVLSVGQIYYYDQRQVSLNGDGDANRSDSPLAGEFTVKPLRNLDIKVSGLWDPRNSDTEEGRSQLRFHSDDYEYLFNASHRYKQDDDPDEAIEQMDFSTLFPITEQFSVFGRWLYDLNDDRTIGTVAGVEYASCCWRVQMFARSYLVSDDLPDELDFDNIDREVVVRFVLKGLGGAGSGDLGDLEKAIPGYARHDREENRGLY